MKSQDIFAVVNTKDNSTIICFGSKIKTCNFINSNSNIVATKAALLNRDWTLNDGRTIKVVRHSFF